MKGELANPAYGHWLPRLLDVTLPGNVYFYATDLLTCYAQYWLCVPYTKNGMMNRINIG